MWRMRWRQNQGDTSSSKFRMWKWVRFQLCVTEIGQSWSDCDADAGLDSPPIEYRLWLAIQKRQRRRLRRGDYEVHNGNDGNDGNDGKGVGSQDGKIRFRWRRMSDVGVSLPYHWRYEIPYHWDMRGIERCKKISLWEIPRTRFLWACPSCYELAAEI